MFSQNEKGYPIEKGEYLGGKNKYVCLFYIKPDSNKYVSADTIYSESKSFFFIVLDESFYVFPDDYIKVHLINYDIDWDKTKIYFSDISNDNSFSYVKASELYKYPITNSYLYSISSTFQVDIFKSIIKSGDYYYKRNSPLYKKYTRINSFLLVPLCNKSNK